MRVQWGTSVALLCLFGASLVQLSQMGLSALGVCTAQQYGLGRSTAHNSQGECERLQCKGPAQLKTAACSSRAVRN